MFWIIIILIGIIFFLIKFALALNHDREDLKSINIEEKFHVILNMLNTYIFNGNATTIRLNAKSFYLHDEGQNQIILFKYSTGNLTVIWKYKYFQKEVVHEKQYADVRNLSIFEQEKIADDIIKEMNIVIAKHKIDVLGESQYELSSTDSHPTAPTRETINKNAQQIYNVNISEKADMSSEAENSLINNAPDSNPFNSHQKYSKEATTPAQGELAKREEEIKAENETNCQGNKNESSPDENYWIGLGLKNYENNKFQKAIDFFSKAIEINPYITEPYIGRGDSKEKLYMHEEAIKDFDKAIAIDPEHSRAYNNRGFSKQMMGMDLDAMLDFDIAIRIDSLKSAAYANRGNSKANLGDLDAAIEDFDKSIAINPQKSEYYNNRGIAFFQKQQIDKAFKDFSRAIELNPESADSYANRGVAFGSIGKPMAALDDFNKGLQLRPTDEVLFCHRGQIKYTLNDKVGAKLDFERAAKLGNNEAVLYLKTLY